MSPKDCAYIVERLAIRFMAMVADHERQLAEHRTSFGARTEADAKIIAGLRAELKQLQKERADGRSAVVDLLSEHEGLRIQVQDMRAEIARLKMACNAYAADWATAGKACRMRDNEYPLGAVIRLVRDDAERAEVAKRLVAERDALRAEVAALKSQTPRHPVKVGEWVKRTKKCAHLGHVAKVLAFIEPCSYEVQCIDGRGIWYFHNCEPCDPPNHDTEAGKAAAEAALKTEPVTDEIKVGDVAKVVGASGDLTAQSDIGKIGEVLKIDFGDGTVLLSRGGWVNRCDVRKVTT